MNISLKRNNDFFKINVLTFIIFAFLFIINYLFPITGDDIIPVHNNNLNMESIISNVIHFGNGRFLGNFFYYLIRIPVICALQKSVFLTGIIYLSSKLLNINSLFSYSVLSLTLIYPCASIFSQAYTWSAGFQNYVCPIFFILLSLLLLKIYFERNSTVSGVFSCLPIFAAQFFSENTSIFNVILFFCLTVLIFIKHKKLNFVLCLNTIISAAGFVLMMVIPKMLNVDDKMESYREVSMSVSSVIRTAIFNYRIFTDCMICCFILWFLLTAILLPLKKNLFRNKAVDTIITFILIALPCYSLMYDFFIKEFVTPDFHIKTLLNIGLLTLYFISIAIIFIKKYIATKEKHVLYSAIAYALGLISFAPLLIVTPIGARTFYLPFICFVISTFILISNTKTDIFNNKNAILTSVMLLICLLTSLTFIFYDVKSSEITRNNYLTEEIKHNPDQITIPLLPHQELIHEDDSLTHWGYFFYFNGTDTPEICFEPFEFWNISNKNPQ